ncbi:hypothetical protein D9M71_582580 [compost metagenome]
MAWPSGLKVKPEGMIMPATGLETPAFSILAIICGSTDSDELVPSTVNSSSLIKRRNFHRLKPQ